jgi:aminoglycoside phosphotransferase (APT) family kinase protein
MPDGLGARIGIGRTAEVFVWRDGQIVKLLRPGFPDRLAQDEARTARLVTGVGLSAPRLIDTMHIGGRAGLVYERLDGQSMLDAIIARPWLVDVFASRFADLHAAMHTASGTSLPDVKSAYRRSIEQAGDALGPSRVRGVLDQLERLPGGSVVCHGDMHPGNVIMATSGPKVIDWLTAGCGPPEADIARTGFLLTRSAVPGTYPRLERAIIEAVRRRFARTYLRSYRRMRAIDDAQLDGWRLPVYAGRLTEAIAPEREQLLRSIDDDLARLKR